MFSAFYEDAIKLEAAAKANGWTDGDGSMLDFADAESLSVHTGKLFKSKDDAVAWLQSEINALRTVFGVGEVREIEEIDRPQRCQYCTCQGHKQVHRYVVSDIGVETDEAIDDCYND